MQETITIEPRYVRNTADSEPSLTRTERVKDWFGRKMPWMRDVAVTVGASLGLVAVGCVAAAVPIIAAVSVFSLVSGAVAGGLGIFLGVWLGFAVLNVIVVVELMLAQSFQ